MFSLIIACSFSQGIFKQSQKGFNISSEIGNYGIYLFPNLTLDIKKHTIACGPTFIIYPGYYLVNKPNKAINPKQKGFYGCHLFYQYNFRPERGFDFFVQTNLIYENIELMNYGITSTNIVLEWKSRDVNIIQTFGIGGKINFSKKMYFNTSIDFGFYYMNKHDENPYYSSQSEDHPFNIAGIIRIGCGYKF